MTAFLVVLAYIVTSLYFDRDAKSKPLTFPGKCLRLCRVHLIHRKIEQIEKHYLAFEAVMLEARAHLETMELGMDRRTYASKIDRLDDKARKECVMLIECLERQLDFK